MGIRTAAELTIAQYAWLGSIYCERNRHHNVTTSY